MPEGDINSILAGGAYIEIAADTSEMQKGLSEADKEVQDFARKSELAFRGVAYATTLLSNAVRESDKALSAYLDSMGSAIRTGYAFGLSLRYIGDMFGVTFGPRFTYFMQTFVTTSMMAANALTYVFTRMTAEAEEVCRQMDDIISKLRSAEERRWSKAIKEFASGSVTSILSQWQSFVTLYGDYIDRADKWDEIIAGLINSIGRASEEELKLLASRLDEGTGLTKRQLDEIWQAIAKRWDELEEQARRHAAAVYKATVGGLQQHAEAVSAWLTTQLADLRAKLQEQVAIYEEAQRRITALQTRAAVRRLGTEQRIWEIESEGEERPFYARFRVDELLARAREELVKFVNTGRADAAEMFEHLLGMAERVAGYLEPERQIEVLKQIQALADEMTDEQIRREEETKRQAQEKWNALRDTIQEVLRIAQEEVDKLWERLANLTNVKLEIDIAEAMASLQQVQSEAEKLVSTLSGLRVPQSFSMEALAPTIPRLQMGGIVTKPTLALIGESGPEAVIPLKERGAAGGNVAIHIHAQNPLDPNVVERIAHEMWRLRNRGRIQ